MNPDPEPLDRLIGRFLDGLTSPAETEELSRIIETDPAARERYLDFAGIHAALSADESFSCPERAREMGLAPEGIPFPPPRPTAPPLVAFPWRWPAAAAALVLAGFFAFRPPAAMQPTAGPLAVFAVDGPLSIPVETAEPVAVLKRVADVEWTLPLTSPSVGEMLPPGWLRLKRGTVQLEFISGARLLVEGPAAVRLDSENSAYLESGKASAFVPEPAHGFQLHGPGLEVEDLGTAFGMEVAAGKAPEVHVFDGSVSLSTASATTTGQTLFADRAVKLDGDGFLDVPVRPSHFPNGEELAQRAAADSRQRFADWKKSLITRADDPAALLSFTFDEQPEWQRTVGNFFTTAGNGRTGSTASTGSLVGAGWTSGRWPGKQGIEFRSLGDRLCFTVPGQHPALTLAAWVRVDSLPNDYNSLLLPSHYAVGSLHWTLERGGELRLTMLNDVKRTLTIDGWDGPVSGPAISSMDLGRWIFLATTYDSATGTVTHYRDGRNIGSSPFKHRLPAVLGQMEFGNWGADGSSPDNRWTRSQPRPQRIRNFVGRLDELTILSRALPAEELMDLYLRGRP